MNKIEQLQARSDKFAQMAFSGQFSVENSSQLVAESIDSAVMAEYFTKTQEELQEEASKLFKKTLLDKEMNAEDTITSIADVCDLLIRAKSYD